MEHRQRHKNKYIYPCVQGRCAREDAMVIVRGAPRAVARKAPADEANFSRYFIIHELCYTRHPRFIHVLWMSGDATTYYTYTNIEGAASRMVFL